MRTILGITGSICSGKSLFSSMLEQLGFALIDSDKIVHELYKPGNKGYNALVKSKSLKPKIALTSDGSIDKEKLRQRIFKNPEYKKQIEKIIHPLVIKEIKNLITETPKDKSIVVEIPLLFEKNLQKLVDSTVVVQSPVEQIIERVMNKFNVPEDEATKIIETQMPIYEKLYKCDLVVLNNGTTKELMEKAKMFGDLIFNH